MSDFGSFGNAASRRHHGRDPRSEIRKPSYQGYNSVLAITEVFTSYMNVLNTIRTRKLLSSTLILFTLSVGILIGTLVNTGVKAAKDQAAPGATPLVIPNPVQLSTAFSQLAKQLEPSVVNISVSYEPKAASSTKQRG